MSRIVGNYYENLALQFLLRRGLKLIARNFRCRFGEIDLIMQDKTSIIFIEVRYRKSHTHGSGAETVHCIKQQRLIKTAQVYLLHHPYDKPCRFDVLSINPFNNIDWVKAAFSL